MQVKLVSSEHWPLTLDFAAAGTEDKVRSSLAGTGILYVQERGIKKEVCDEAKQTK